MNGGGRSNLQPPNVSDYPHARDNLPPPLTQRYELPEEIATKCVQLTQALGLVFGAIDLAVQDETYYFLEINPHRGMGMAR